MVRYAIRLTAPDPARHRAGRSGEQFPNQGWRIRDPVRRRAGRQPLHRPDRAVPDAGRPDLAAGRRHRRGQRRARLARRAGAHDRHAALPGRVGRSGVRRLPDPGAGAGRRRDRPRRGRRGGRAAAGRRVSWPAILPVPPVLGLYPGPLLLAAAYGLLIALCFALWPLGRAARIPGGALFRDGLVPEATRPSAALIAVNAALALALVGLTVATATDRRFRVVFLRRRRPDPGAVPCRRVGGDAAGPAGAGVAVPVGPAWGSAICTVPARRRRCCCCRPAWACRRSRRWR